MSELGHNQTLSDSFRVNNFLARLKINRPTYKDLKKLQVELVEIKSLRQEFLLVKNLHPGFRTGCLCCSLRKNKHKTDKQAKEVCL